MSDFECPRCGHCCLQQTEQEPVAHVYLFDKAGRPLVAWDNAKDIKLGDKLYAAPKQWVGLTDEEVSYFRYAATFCDELDTAYMAELIEKDLKEKNT